MSEVSEVFVGSITSLFFLYSMSNSGDVSSLFLGFWVTGVFSIEDPLFITYIWAVTVVLKFFAVGRCRTILLQTIYSYQQL